MIDIVNLLEKLTPQPMAAISALVGFFLLVLFAGSDRGSLSIKMAGSAFVLALAFGANQTFTYGLAMVIVATLVTELEFLEKIAAIFLRSESYFRFKIEAATRQQLAEKQLADEAASTRELDSESLQASPEVADTKKPADGTQEAVSKERDETTKPVVSSPEQSKIVFARDFEAQVAAAIASGMSPFKPSGTVSRNVAITDVRSGQTLIADIVYQRGDVHLIIEVKTSNRISAVHITQLERLVRAYKDSQSERKVAAVVFSVLVLPVRRYIPSGASLQFVLAFDGQQFSSAENSVNDLEKLLSTKFF